MFSTGFEAIEPAKSLRGYARDFEDQLAKWKQIRKCDNEYAPDLLAYVLEDQYSGKSFHFSSLTPIDQRKAKLLQERCQKQEVRPFLGKLKATVKRISGHGKDKAMMYLSDLIDFDGTTTIGESLILDQNLIQEDVYVGRKSNVQDCYPGAEFEEDYFVDWVWHLVFIVARTLCTHSSAGFRLDSCTPLSRLGHSRYQRGCDSIVD